MIGKRIRLARQLAGLTQEGVATALSQAGVSATKQAISNYETGKREPSARVLLALAGLFEVHTDYFFNEPSVAIEWLSYRKHSILPSREQEAIQGYALDVAALDVEIRHLLYPNETPQFPEPIPVFDLEGAEAAARNLRDTWNLHPLSPIQNLTERAESHGVLIINWDRNTEHFDGLSGWCNGDVPVVVIKTGGETDRRRFSLAHELGHLAMKTTEEDEKLAHRFAAALLVPAAVARQELGERRNSISLAELGALKRRYGLSIQGWIFRAKDLGIINAELARRLWREVSWRGWRRAEPERYDFMAAEEPIWHEQMILHALEEQYIPLDRVIQVYPDFEISSDPPETSDTPTAVEIMAMDEEERNYWVERSFELAEGMDFEIFDAFGEEEF